MAFLALLIAVILWNLTSVAAYVQKDRWFWQLNSLLEKIMPATAAGIVAILLPSLFVGGLFGWAQPVLFGLPVLALTVLVLLFGLGHGDYRHVWTNYVASLRDGHFQSAYEYALKDKLVSEDEQIETPFALHQRMRSVLAYSSLERWFAPVFWFFVLGVTGVLAYRLLVILKNKSRENNQTRISNILIWVEWLPANLLALTFALAGNFATTYRHFQKILFVEKSSQVIVNDCATSALLLPTSVENYPDEASFYRLAADEIAEIKALVKRSHVIWLACFGFIFLI